MFNLVKKLFIVLFFFPISNLKSQQTMVEVDKIIQTDLNQTFPIIATITSNKDSDLLAPLTGKLNEIFFEEGDFISKGKLITRIDYEKTGLSKSKSLLKLVSSEYNNTLTETKINLSDLNR